MLPAGFAMFLAVGTVAAALHGRLPATGVLIACAAVAGVASFAAEPVACVLLAGIGWLTVIGFSRPPYAQLRPPGRPPPTRPSSSALPPWPERAWVWCSAGIGGDSHF